MSNLPTWNIAKTLIKNRLNQLFDNTGGKVANVFGKSAVLKFPNQEMAKRAMKVRIQLAYNFLHFKKYCPAGHNEEIINMTLAFRWWGCFREQNNNSRKGLQFDGRWRWYSEKTCLSGKLIGPGPNIYLKIISGLRAFVRFSARWRWSEN